MSDEQTNKTADKLAPLVNRLEQELAAINAPFHVHQAQKQILGGFWAAVKELDKPVGSPPPVVPVKKGKASA